MPRVEVVRKKFIKVKAMSDRHVIFKIHRGRRERERVMI